jgi:hypothetical protein
LARHPSTSRPLRQADDDDDDSGGGEETLGNLFLLDTAAKAWEEPVNCESVPRAWHSASYLPTKNLLVTFGGERANGGDGTLEVWLFAQRESERSRGLLFYRAFAK